MGYFPVGFVEAFKALLLTALLFLGPLFEAGIAEGGWREWIRLQGLRDLFSSWIGYRNIIAVCQFIGNFLLILLTLLGSYY